MASTAAGRPASVSPTAGPGPSAAATVTSTASWAVTVLVAGTASSGPASVASTRLTAAASGLPGSLVMPITVAPASRTARHVLMISGVAPDWLSAIIRYPCQSTSAW